MADVVQNSTQYMTPEDLRSMVVYLRSVPAKSGGDIHPRDSFGKPTGRGRHRDARHVDQRRERCAIVYCQLRDVS